MRYLNMHTVLELQHLYSWKYQLLSPGECWNHSGTIEIKICLSTMLYCKHDDTLGLLSFNA